MAVSSSKAVTSSLVQEEIRRDLAREVELRREARKRLQEEDTSVEGDSIDGEESEKGEQQERGRSKSRSKVSERSQSSRGELRKKVYFGGEPVKESRRLPPSYTIYKEGGEGFTKYTVYAKQQQEQERKWGMEKKLQSSVKQTMPTTRPMEVQGKSSKIEQGRQASET